MRTTLSLCSAHRSSILLLLPLALLLSMAPAAVAQPPIYLTSWEGVHGPYGVDVDANGDVFVADYWNHRVRKFSGNGAALAEWGTFGSGQFRG